MFIRQYSIPKLSGALSDESGVLMICVLFVKNLEENIEENEKYEIAESDGYTYYM